MKNRRLASASVIALGSALWSHGAQAQFTALPTITIGHTHPVEHSHGDGRTHSHPVYHTHVVPAPASRPAAAPAPVRVAAPSPVAPPPAPIVAPPMTSSSEKFFTGAQVTAYPYSRPSESLEIVPGLVVTQHSGDGKANQYYLRGFNLDHGTDLALYLDGMPLNMRTHGHGQGYADTNFLIPELLSYVLARKGPYSAQDGDFSSAGSVYLQYIDKIDRGYFGVTGGSFGYGRAFAIQPYKDVAGGSVYGAAEANYYNGPWERGDNLRKFNSVIRWSRGTDADGAALTFMGYYNKWYSTDQIPQRAVATGLKSLWGTLDATDGGTTSRFSLSGRWSQTEGNHASRVEAYAIRSNLELYNNFTYFLAHPDVGDQFRQFDYRTVIGVNAQHSVKWNDFLGVPVESRVGFQGRYDDIRLGLQETFRRAAYQTIGNNYVGEGSIGLWTDTTIHWTPWLATMGGVRFDYYNANVSNVQALSDAPKVLDSNGLPAFVWAGPFNQGSRGDTLVSPKGSITVGPFYKTELFFNYGEGFHSTDARGTTARFATAELGDDDRFVAVANIPLLVKSRGAEIGARTKIVDGLDSSISFFWLNLESENQFVGDAGTTEFGRPSRRYGIEIANHYKPTSWISFDGDVSLVHARFRGQDQQAWLGYNELVQPDALPYGTYLGNAPGNYLFNAPSIVAMGGLELGEQTGWFGGLKYRYFGMRPLTPDGYLKSPATGTMNARLGYRWDNGWRFQIDAFNIFNSRSDQITYGYGSLLPSDRLYGQCLAGAAPASVCGVGVMDRHFKPVEPPAVRVTLGGPLDFSSLPDLRKPFSDLGL